MARALLHAAAILVVALTIAFAIFEGANSFTVPVPHAEYQDCLQAAHNAGEKNPQCPTQETVWERGLRDPVAQYTLWITWFTGVLTILGLAQWVLTYRQIQLSRAEFNATHRATLEVRFVREVAGGIEITVINTGTGSAQFVEARAAIWHLLAGEKFPSPHDLLPSNSFDLRSTFDPSGMDRYTVTDSGDEFRAGFGSPAHVFGWIMYDTVSPTPARRITYFGRKTEALQPELVAVEGSDWNFIQ